MPQISRQEYSSLYGPTVGDRIRLGDTELYVEIEKDLRGYGDEVIYGGGKTLRAGEGGDSRSVRDNGVLDLVITNATIIDPILGVVKADVGIRDGRIAGIGKAGNPAVMDNVDPHLVVGNSTELKNVILFDNVQTPHYNYVGDSILGYKSHMGAGSITSNVKSDKTLVTVKNGAERIETGRKKFGAILGDHVEVGCNSVLNPGTVVGRGSSIYPVSCVRGAIPAGSIVKTGGVVVQRS